MSSGAPVDGDPTWDETPIVTAASYDEPRGARRRRRGRAGRGFAAPGGTALAHAIYLGNPTVADLSSRPAHPSTHSPRLAGTSRLHGRSLTGADHEDRVWTLRAAAVRHQHGGPELGVLLHRGEHVAQAQRQLIELFRDLLIKVAQTGEMPEDLASYYPHPLAARPAPCSPRRPRQVGIGCPASWHDT